MDSIFISAVQTNTKVSDVSSATDWQVAGFRMPTFESYLQFASQSWLNSHTPEQQRQEYEYYCLYSVVNSIMIGVRQSSFYKKRQVKTLQIGRILAESTRAELKPLYDLAQDNQFDTLVKAIDALGISR